MRRNMHLIDFHYYMRKESIIHLQWGGASWRNTSKCACPAPDRFISLLGVLVIEWFYTGDLSQVLHFTVSLILVILSMYHRSWQHWNTACHPKFLSSRKPCDQEQITQIRSFLAFLRDLLPVLSLRERENLEPPELSPWLGKSQPIRFSSIVSQTRRIISYRRFRSRPSL